MRRAIRLTRVDQLAELRSVTRTSAKPIRIIANAPNRRTIAWRLWASLKKAGIEGFARVADRNDPSIRPGEADAPERLTTGERVACQ